MSIYSCRLTICNICIKEVSCNNSNLKSNLNAKYVNSLSVQHQLLQATYLSKPLLTRQYRMNKELFIQDVFLLSKKAL